ncbi:MAG: TIGR02301 family protein, partial [Pseudomonadota bacterium]
RQAALDELAGLLGRSHHLRRICAADVDKDIFRERMAKMLELERTPDRDAYIRAFNTGYRDAGRAHRECDGDARRARAAAGERGGRLIALIARGLAEGDLDSTIAANPKLQAILAAGAEPPEDAAPAVLDLDGEEDAGHAEGPQR